MRALTVGILALLILASAGCAGQKARTHILIPSMEATWPGVRADAERGGATDTELASFEDALANREKVAIIAQWPEIQTAAQDGIDAKLSAEEISPGVAASLRRRLAEFDSAVQAIERRPY